MAAVFIKKKIINFAHICSMCAMKRGLQQSRAENTTRHNRLSGKQSRNG